MRSAFLMAALIASVPALGADLPLRGSFVEEPISQAVQWSGLYVGAHAGYASYNQRYIDYSSDVTMSGARAGVLAGYNLQYGDVVVGLESDIGAGRLSGLVQNPYGGVVSAEQSWQINTRLRVGYSFGPALLFVAGGLAVGRFETDNTSPAYGQDAATATGWTIGGGVEYAIAPGWAIRGEYLYSEFGKKRYVISGPEGPADCIIETGSNPKASIVRFALTYNFSSPVVSRPIVTARY